VRNRRRPPVPARHGERIDSNREQCTPPMDRATITLKNQLAELERLSAFVDQFGERNDIGAGDLFAIKLALDEVVTNVISYGHEAAGEHEIVVRIAREADELAVEVQDDGRPFDPLAVAAPDVDKPLAERPLGGLGIHLTRKMTDRLEYRRQG